jgi:hypothetical protein
MGAPYRALYGGRECVQALGDLCEGTA